jgi:hypothetical protein
MNLAFPRLTPSAVLRSLPWKGKWPGGSSSSTADAEGDSRNPAQGTLADPLEGPSLDEGPARDGGGDVNDGPLPIAARAIDQHGISKASRVWTSRRKKFYDPGLVFRCRVDDVLRVGSIWQIKPVRMERIAQNKYNDVALNLAESGWDEQSPAIIGIGANGFVTILDGNHRLCVILARDLMSRVPVIPVRFHFFDVGDAINPLRSERVWSGTNLPFICYPVGACGQCRPCRLMLAEVETKLRQNGLLPAA